jgi:fucose permease
MIKLAIPLLFIGILFSIFKDSRDLLFKTLGEMIATIVSALLGIISIIIPLVLLNSFNDNSVGSVAIAYVYIAGILVTLAILSKCEFFNSRTDSEQENISNQHSDGNDIAVPSIKNKSGIIIVIISVIIYLVSLFIKNDKKN